MLKVHLLILLSVSLVTPPQHCARSSTQDRSIQRAPDTVRYSLDKPDLVVELPRKLNEISGLTVIDSSRVAAIQDEKGIIFILNSRTGKIEHEVQFAGNGDYEGIERAGENIFVLRSDGDLFVLDIGKLDSNKRQKARRIRTRLSARYDTEGLTFDPSNNRLLIACKEYAGKGLGKSRSIFAFDLDSETVGKNPEHSISIAAIDETIEGVSVSFARFKPSAIALHPTTGNLFVLSSRDRLLIEMDMHGDIVGTGVLPQSIARQPEGIAILPDGDLLIVSEAAGKRARLLRFKPKNDNQTHG